MNIIVREAKKEDLRNAAHIAVRGWQTAYRGIIDDSYLDSMSVDDTAKRWEEKFSNEGFIVAEIDGEIVGFARFSNEAKDDPIHDSELWALYVKPEMKGNGIGRELVNYVKDYFRKNNKKKMVIWCLKDNYPSRGFYEKMGGKLVDWEKDQVRDGKIYKEVGFSYDL